MAEEAVAEVVEVAEEVVEEVATNTWPDTWRDDWAEGNDKMAANLARFASPTAALTAGYAAHLKISSGEYKSSIPFPDKGTDDEKTSWRSNAGLPDSFDKYEVGQDVGENDKEVIDRFLEFAYGENMTPDGVKSAVKWFYQDRDAMTEAGAESDALVATESEDKLRAEWGEEYRANMNRVDGFLDTAPEGMREKILNSRMDDGTMLKSSPEIMKFLVDTALTINPATTLVPGAGDNILGSITDEINDIKVMMGSKNSDYWKGPKAEGLQKRYAELLEAQEKMDKRK